jgi:Cu(I)/Ag(I) efflux system membrane fusion protein
MKVRLEADNPGYALRPDMFVDVELPIKLEPTLAVPTDAVFDTGLKKTVFVDRGEGFFEPREVETGWRLGNRVEITRGLNPGERIVVSGTFLIDSESRMELAAAGMAENLSQDPVCGVPVSIKKSEQAGRKSVYQEKTYYFCSDECKERFDLGPEKYTGQKTAPPTPQK